MKGNRISVRTKFGILISVITFGYLLPTGIAVARSQRNIVLIFIFNFFLGWTGIIWMITLLWATLFDSRKNAVELVHYGSKVPTREASILRDELEARGVQVYVELHDGFKHIDLALPKAKLNIEVDGIQHLTNPQQIVADLNRGYYSHKRGFATMHIPNEMIRSHLREIADGLAEASKIREQRIKVHLNSLETI
jgi:very-short-patch-repair endonuclease